ncbi:unnamed protein product [Schistosoma mattheei]|uniref:Uncharacterized protein n=1 Tax=Schistosoma mattheei TaxID=31246 RepID=A0A183NMK6_9TREM|nr:unnamed protein product [Schistosoma mattheei]
MFCPILNSLAERTYTPELMFTLELDPYELFFVCSIIESYWLHNHNYYRFIRINWPESQVNMNIPIGYHVNVRLKDSEGEYSH